LIRKHDHRNCARPELMRTSSRPAIGDTQRTGESKDHDQAKKDFGDTVNWFQRALGGKSFSA
jgi:hypothetical protein